MISYKPLFHTLIEKDLTLDDLVKNEVVSAMTTSKFKKGESIMLSTAEKICKYLDCEIQDIVRFEKDG